MHEMSRAMIKKNRLRNTRITTHLANRKEIIHIIINQQPRKCDRNILDHIRDEKLVKSFDQGRADTSDTQILVLFGHDTRKTVYDKKGYSTTGY